MGEAARVIAGYRLERQLGRGAAGDVWLGRHVDTGGLAAVKLLRAAARRSARRTIEREREAIARLSHPHIVPLYARGPDYLVTAFVKGRDLLHRMRTPIAPALAVRIARQIAAALEHAHQRDVVHRDVKPSNILLDDDERAHLVDFGVARLLDHGEEAGSAGTPAFMAPEQARGAAGTPASDQYALGRTLLALLVGDRLPLSPSAALALFPPELPEALRAVIERATWPEPGERFPSMGAFEEALATIDLDGAAPQQPLLPVRRPLDALAWCTHAVAKVEPAPAGEPQEADYRLSALCDAGALERERFEAFRRETGYADLGWTVWAGGERLGPITSGSALARATEIVVLLHGLTTARSGWQNVPRAVCRNNGHAVVLVPDVFGNGESVFVAEPSDAQLEPRAMVMAVRAWLALLGLGALPTVFVGHSVGGLALLSVSDAELGVNVHRVVLSPVCPWLNRGLQRSAVAVAAAAHLVTLLPCLVRPLAWLVVNLDVSARTFSAAQRRASVEVIVKIGVRLWTRLVRATIRARPPQIDARERLALVVTPDDPYSPEPMVTRALAELGIAEKSVQRLAAGGGHYPHLSLRQMPERANRDVDQFVGLIDTVLESTRSSTASSTEDSLLSPARAAAATQPL
jgi:serine/threonine-protein kinase